LFFAPDAAAVAATAAGEEEPFSTKTAPAQRRRKSPKVKEREKS